MELRPYQLDVIERCREAIRSGKRRLILQAATGAGKTVMGAALIRATVAKGNPCLFLAHRRELVYQCSDKLDRFGIQHGILMSGEFKDCSLPVQIASVGTLYSRCIKRDSMYLPKAALIIPDECHRSLARSWEEILARYPQAVVIGLTATPARGDGRGLGLAGYEEIIETVSTKQLISEGFLVKCRIVAPTRPDLEGCKIKGGDYVLNAELEGRMNTRTLVGDIVKNWQQRAADRRTIVFCAGVAHADHVRQAFAEAGVAATTITGEMAVEHRNEIIAGVHRGDWRVITNCDVLTEGFDCPPISCIVVARPTKSIVRWRQMVGRCMRPAEGKADALIIDHSGSVYDPNLGFPDDDIRWTLDSTRKAARVTEPGELAEPQLCPQCQTMFRGRVCFACGYEIPRREREFKPPQQRDGELQELERNGELAEHELTKAWKSCLGVAANRGLNFRRAVGMFIGRTKQLPWKCKNLPHMPGRRDYDKLVGEVLPQFVRTKYSKNVESND